MVESFSRSENMAKVFISTKPDLDVLVNMIFYIECAVRYP